MDDPELIDDYQDELSSLVARMQGELLPDTVSFLLSEAVKGCWLQRYAADWLVCTGDPWQGQRP